MRSEEVVVKGDERERGVVVVTGASAGVGRATVAAFARRGARLGPIALGRDGLDGARRDVEASGGTAYVVVADVADHQQVERAATEIEDALGPIEVSVNNVAGSTAITILGDKLAPGLGDRRLARTGYDAQQRDEPADPGQPDNLFEPLPGDWGAHGGFDRQGHPRSIQFWATRHRRPLTALAGALGLAVVARSR
jgi:short chain dehydrogenase